MAKHDVFICFSSKDESKAREVVSFLESHGVNCWISSRNVEPGHNYQDSIVRALESAKAIVFLFSENSAKSNEIKKELSLGASDNIPVIPLRLSAIAPSGALRYELATRQWIDAFGGSDDAFGRLLTAVKAALDHEAPATSEPVRRAAPPPSPEPAKVPAVRLGAEEFEAVRGLLARHVGPIAKVLTQKATTEARSLDDFCERLAAYVQAPAERVAFAQALRARLAAKSWE